MSRFRSLRILPACSRTALLSVALRAGRMAGSLTRCSAKNTLRLPSAILSVTLRPLRCGTLLTAPPEMPPGAARPVFRSARCAVCLLPGAPRFSLSRCAPSATAHCLPLRRKCRRVLPGLFSGLRGALCACSGGSALLFTTRLYRACWAGPAPKSEYPPRSCCHPARR